MCYAIPGRVTEISGDSAVIDYGGVKKRANISLVDASIGDYVLIHAGFAIQVMDERAARISLKLIEQQIKKNE